MIQEKIDRINELSRKSRTNDGLTEGEKAEREILRNEYRNGYIRNLTEQLDNVTIVEPDGMKHKIISRD